MLKELTKMEQRYDAVIAVIRDGLEVTEVAEKYGVSRQTVHSWLRRYEADGLAGLADRSHRPRSCPHQMDAVIEARLLEMRRLHGTWGQRRLAHELKKDFEAVPSERSIHRALVRHGLIAPKSRRKRLVTYKRWERGRTDGGRAAGRTAGTAPGDMERRKTREQGNRGGRRWGEARRGPSRRLYLGERPDIMTAVDEFRASAIRQRLQLVAVTMLVASIVVVSILPHEGRDPHLMGDLAMLGFVLELAAILLLVVSLLPRSVLTPRQPHESRTPDGQPRGPSIYGGGQLSGWPGAPRRLRR